MVELRVNYGQLLMTFHPSLGLKKPSVWKDGYWGIMFYRFSGKSRKALNVRRFSLVVYNY